MPLFRFHCSDCQHDFEELLWPSESQSSVRCPACASALLERELPRIHVGGGRAAATPADPFCGRCGESRAPCDA